jgi:hypothetical protein
MGRLRLADGLGIHPLFHYGKVHDLEWLDERACCLDMKLDRLMARAEDDRIGELRATIPFG